MRAFTTIVLALLAVCAQASPPGNLPRCTEGDGKIPVKVWQPTLNDEGEASQAPDAEPGEVFFIELHRENSAMGCGTADPDQLFSVPVPDPQGPDFGGVAVNFRGNTQFANGYCYVSGYFLNHLVPGMHQGWTETYFEPLELSEVVTSQRYCLASARSRPAATTAQAVRACYPGPDLSIVALLADRVRNHTGQLQAYIELQEEHLTAMGSTLPKPDGIALSSRSRAMQSQVRAVEERIAEIDKYVELRRSRALHAECPG